MEFLRSINTWFFAEGEAIQLSTVFINDHLENGVTSVKSMDHAQEIVPVHFNLGTAAFFLALPYFC